MEIRTFNPDDFETVYKIDEKTAKHTITERAELEYLSHADLKACITDLEGRISSIYQLSNKIQQPSNKANEYRRLYFIQEGNYGTKIASLQGPFPSQPSVQGMGEDEHKMDIIRVIIPIHYFPIELYSLTRVLFEFLPRDSSMHKSLLQYMENAFMASLKSPKLQIKRQEGLEVTPGQYTVLSNTCGVILYRNCCEIYGFDDNEVKEIAQSLSHIAYWKTDPSLFPVKGLPSLSKPTINREYYFTIEEWMDRGFAYNVHLTDGVATADTFKSMITIRP